MPAGAAQLVGFLPLIGLVLLMYFMMVRPQQKREKEVAKMRSELKMGDNIITVGGIKGKIVKISDDFVVIESTSEKTKLEFTRSAILSVVNKNGEEVK